MNRPTLRSPVVLRAMLLVGIAAVIMQLRDELLDATALEAGTFWVVRLFGIGLSLVLADRLIKRIMPDRLDSPPWLKPVVISGLAAVIPIAAIEMALEMMIPVLPELDDAAVRDTSWLLAYLSEYGTFASILLPLNFLAWLLIDQREPSEIAITDAQALSHQPEEPSFLSKADAIAASDVIALSAEEHYVRILTEDGAQLIHHPLGKAVAEMPDSLGIRVHRSWWVADRHVVNAQRGDRRWSVLLSCGDWVPVSDRYTKAARDRGLLEKRARSV